MSLKRIRIELARTKEFPQGNPRCGYEFKAPLGADGHLDADAWPAVKQLCTVHRFWQGEDDETGSLIRTRGGPVPSRRIEDALDVLQELLKSKDERVRLSAALSMLRLHVQLSANVYALPVAPADIARRLLEDEKHARFAEDFL